MLPLADISHRIWPGCFFCPLGNEPVYDIFGGSPREMSELWLPRWHCPFLFWPRGGGKRRVGFWTWDCGWLMAINSISHLSSLPHYWVVAGLSWWVLPCCCSAVLLTSEQAVAASSAALRRCSFDFSEPVGRFIFQSLRGKSTWVSFYFFSPAHRLFQHAKQHCI